MWMGMIWFYLQRILGNKGIILMNRHIKYFLLVIIIFNLVSFNGCWCSKKKNSTEPSTKTISFVSTGTPADNSVYLETLTTNNEEIALVLKVKGGKDVYGAALEINYDGGKIAFISSSKGSYLGAETDFDFYAKLYQDQQGKLLLGMSRTGSVSGVNNDGILSTMIFRALTVQNDTLIEFNAANSCLKSSTGNIPGTVFIGGKLNCR